MMATSGGSEPTTNSGIIEGERHVIAAAHHLVKALKCTNIILSSETRALLSDLDVHLSAIRLDGHGEAGNRYEEAENKLFSAQQVITSLHSSHVRIWDCNLIKVSEYLQAVQDVHIVAASLEKSTNKNSKTKELFDLAHKLLQMAMDRLERELSDILLQNQLCFEQEQQGFSPATEENNQICNESIIDESVEEVNAASQRASSSTENEDYAMDFVHPDTIPLVKSIAELMIDSGYDKEFFCVFVGFWRSTLIEYLTVFLGFERFSIEDLLQMEWKSLNFRIKKWRCAIKAFVGIYLTGAKRLFDQVLGNSNDADSLSSSCLLEASKVSLMSLLNFGEAILIGANRPEWLFCLLDMHEALTSVMPLFDSLFQEETGSLIKIEFRKLLNRLRGSAKTIFLDLGNCIALCFSNTPFANGDVHHLTKYVMNYIMCFADYDVSLKLLLHEDPNDEHETTTNTTSCPLAIHLQSLISTLETNLQDKSNLYKESAMRHIFMLNNMHYIIGKIESSAISRYFGDEWIRTNMAKFRHHAMCYERATWGSILELIRIDAKVTRATLKVRCRAFATAFENLYRTQTRWVVPNLQLREYLRIYASETVIPAYRSFVSKINDAISEKHIKYKEQELEIYIFDLLEGNPKSLNYSWKR